jgi:hypothetical protein
LAGSVSLADLQQTFDPLVRCEAAFAMVAKPATANRATVLDQARIPHAIVIFATEWTTHEYPKGTNHKPDAKSLAISTPEFRVYRLRAN